MDTTPTAATAAPTPERLPSYRNKALARAMKEHRAACKSSPKAAQTLARVEQLLKYALRVVETWDDTHARRAEELLGFGLYDAAATAATKLFEEARRDDLYRRIHQERPITLLADDSAERMAEAFELGREVLA